MRQAARTARYDQALGLEAYSLRAVDSPATFTTIM